jgi:uncharacterized repeat protein (TIGR02543 family)
MSYFKGFGTGSNSNGQFWYGDYGFLYKKNVGVGGRKNPLYGLICNKPTYIYNKFKPGTGGVGAQSKANRRAQNKRSTVCLDNNCGLFYNYLGQYPRYSYNSINGYFPYPLPLDTNYIVNGEYKSLSNNVYNNVLLMYGESSFIVTGIKTLQVNYIFVGGGGGGGAGGYAGGGGGGGGGGGEISYGVCDLYPGRYTIKIGEGGNGGTTSLGNSSTGGSNGGQTVMYESDSGKVRINAFGGEGGQYAYSSGDSASDDNINGLGGNGGISIQTDGTIGGAHADEVGKNGNNGGGGGGSNYVTSLSLSIKKGGNGAKNKIITNNNPLNIDLIRNSIIENSNILSTTSNSSFSYISELINAYTKNTIPSLNIFGTGGGAGNSGEKPVIVDFDNLPRGGKGGDAGGITIGFGGIGYISDSSTPQNGENGREALPFLGGGGGGGGGGTAQVINSSGNLIQPSGDGGQGGKGGRGLAILYFNNNTGVSGAATGHVNNIPQGIPTIQQLNNPGLNTSLSSFSITYKSGTSTDGSPPVDTLSPYITGSTVTILGDSNLTKTGYSFVGWNTQLNGTGTMYSTQETFQITSNLTLYPAWTLTRYSVKYDKNNVFASTAPVDGKSPYTENSIVTVLGKGGMTSSNPLNDVFVNWNTKSNATGNSYVQGSTFVIENDTTLYAQWGFTITYDAGEDGSNPPTDPNSPYIKDSTVTVLSATGMTNSNPLKHFKEWREGLSNVFNPGNTFTIQKNTTLTAIWEL